MDFTPGNDYGGDQPSVDFVITSREQSFIPELAGARGIVKFRQMAETDDTVGSMLWAIETTLGQLEWGHKACENGKQSDKPEAQEARDFADSLLADMTGSFSSFTENASSMIWAGFAVAEILFKRRNGQTADKDGYTSQFNDGLWGIADLAPRRPENVIGWTNSGSRVTGVNITTASRGSVTVPIEKMLHFTIRGSTGNPWGRSLLTNAYRSWALKQNLQDSEALGIRRELCGLPTARVPKRDMDLAASARIKKAANGTPTGEEAAADARIQAIIGAVTKMRFNETSGIVMPSDVYLDDQGKPTSVLQYDFKMVTSSGQRAIEPRAAIRDYDRSIARTAMMQFLHLGDRSTGSYALSDSQSTLALKSIKALTGQFSQEWRLKVLSAAWILNQRDPRWMPVLESSPITEDSLQVIGAFLVDLAQAQDLMTAFPEVRASMFARIGVAPGKDPPPATPSLPEPTPGTSAG